MTNTIPINDALGGGGLTNVAEVGKEGQTHNRLIATAGSTLPADIAHATWAESEGVHYARFKVTGGTAGHRIRVVFDTSPVDDTTDDTQAAAWLASASASASVDVEYYEIAQGSTLGANEWSEWFQFESPLRRVDAISVDADVAQTIFIEAM